MHKHSPSTNVYSGYIGCALMLSSVFLHANTPDPNGGLYALSLAELLEIKVSGSTLVDEKISEVPAAVTVFSRKQIQRMGVNTLAELMNLVPGYQNQRSADNGAFTMASSRNRRTAAVSTEILVVIDGIRTQINFQSGSSWFLELPLNNIERVEFMRGPGSAIYGSNAMMGVINIVTVNNENSVKLEAGNNKNKNLGLLLGTQFDEGSLDLLVDAQSSAGQNYLLRDAYSADPISVHDPYLNTNAILKGQYRDFDFHIQYRYREGEEFYVIESLDPDHNKVGLEYLRYAAGYNFDFDNFNSNISAYYIDYESFLNAKYSDYGAFSSVSDPASDEALLFESDRKSEEKSVSMKNEWLFSQDSRLLFGAEWRSEYLNSFVTRLNYDYSAIISNTTPIPYYGDFEQQQVFTRNFDRQTVVGYYAQWLKTLYQKNYLTVGFRYDEYRELDENKVSPRLALVHEFNDDHSVKFLYAHAFRAPTLSNLNADTTWTRGDPTLHAETVKTFELIWSGKNASAFWNLGFFHSTFEDPILLETPDETDNTTRVLTNSEHDDVAGAEFEISYQLNEQWLLRNTATWIFQRDDITFRESNKLLSFELNYNTDNWNTNLALAWRGQRATYDPLETDEKRTLDAYWLSFAKVQYKINREWQVFTRLGNLADQDIYYASPGSRLPQGVPARGREISLGVTFTL